VRTDPNHLGFSVRLTKGSRASVAARGARTPQARAASEDACAELETAPGAEGRRSFACLQGIKPWSGSCRPSLTAPAAAPADARASRVPAEARLQDAGAGGSQLGRRQARHARLQRLHGRQALLPGRAAQARGHVLARQRGQRLLRLRARQRPALPRRARASARAESSGRAAWAGACFQGWPLCLAGRRARSPGHPCVAAFICAVQAALPRAAGLQRAQAARARPQPGRRRMRLLSKVMGQGRGQPAGRRRRRRRSPAPRPGPPRAARASWRPPPGARAPAG